MGTMREIVEVAAIIAPQCVNIPLGGCDNHVKVAITVDISNGRSSRNAADTVALPELTSARIERGDIAVSVDSNNFRSKVAIHVSRGHLRPNLAHLDRPTVDILAAGRQRVHEAEACGHEHFQFTIPVNVNERRRRESLGSDL